MKVKLQLIKEIPFRISLRLSVYYVVQAIYCYLKGLYLAGELAGKEVGHIHTHFAESSGLVACIVSKLTGIPYSVTMHRHDIFDNPNKKLITFLIKNSSFSVSISQFNKDVLIELDVAFEDKILVQAQQKLEAFKEQHLKDIGIANAIVVSGTHYRQILDYAKSEKIDLIIMGKGTRGQRMMFGSVADKVSRLAKVPVLLIKSS